MELYGIYFAALVCFNVALALYRHQSDKHASQHETLALPPGDSKASATKFKKEYFTWYSLVVAADWLQGPYMYTLYKHEKSLPESTVASLFTIGFVVAGITASFVGSLADRHGRRTACLVYCVTYSLSCLTVLSNNLAMLFAGRALGGLSTTLQYSVFETWMVAEYHKRELSGTLSLGSMFSLSVTLSSVIAILSGVFGEAIVRYTGTKTSPFMAALVCLLVAFVGIQQRWSENYGEAPSSEKQHNNDGWRMLLADRRVIALTAVTTFFEGSMYIFVFFWAPALVSARSLVASDSPLPFGLIFSCFMCAVMLGSTIVGLIKPDNVPDACHLMLSILVLASYGLIFPTWQVSEGWSFWSFALFEVCVGLYFPTMSRLKSEVVDDAVRAKVYGLMRLPLNLFIAVALGFTKDGDEHRSRVFTTTGALLLCAFYVVKRSPW